MWRLLRNKKLLWASADLLYCSTQPSLTTEPQSLPYVQNTWVNLGDTIPKVTVKRCVQVEMLRIGYFLVCGELNISVLVFINHVTSGVNESHQVRMTRGQPYALVIIISIALSFCVQYLSCWHQWIYYTDNFLL